MSIFQKYCPECATPNSPGAISCNCGYCFDPEALASADPSAYADQQDFLYRDYLAARIVQAEAELVVARERANAEPGSTYKASGTLLVEQALNALQAEMKQLSLRVSAAAPSRRAAPIAKPAVSPPRVAAPIKIPVAPKAVAPTPILSKALAPIAIAPPAVAKKVTPVSIGAPRAPAAPTKSYVPHKAPTPVSTKKPVTLPVAAKPKAVVTARPATVVARVVTPPPRRPAPVLAIPATPKAPAKPSVAAPTPVNGQHRPINPSVTTRPNESFRRVQAQKADAITRSKAAPIVSRPPQTTIRPTTQRASADIPPVVLLKSTSMQECPNCTAAVAATLTRCTCGYMLSSPGEEVPAVTLDATALAILTDGISSLSSNRRR